MIRQWMISMALAVLLCVSLQAGERAREQEALQLAREAGELFDKGNDLAATDHAAAREQWQKAALRLERLSGELHVANGPLFYNLGNVYFRLGDMGRAILAYRRAEQFMPNDAKLQKNLAFARRNCQDSVPEQQKTRILKTLFFWHYDFSLQTRERMFLFCFCLACALASIRLFWKRSWLSRTAVLLAVLAIVLAVSMGVTEWSRIRHCPGVILAPELTARKGNSQSYEPSFTEPLHAGTEFVLLEQRGDWLEIALADGRTCWVPTAEAALITGKN